MSTRSNITVVLNKEDLGKNHVFNADLVKHPHVIPAGEAGYYREAYLYTGLKAFAVPSIAVPKRPGTALCVYCQWDGYLDGVGAALLKDFPDYRSALNLTLLGDLESIIANETAPGEGEGYTGGVLPSPKRHPNQFPNVHVSDNDPENDFGGAAFHYLFEKGRWWVRTRDVNNHFRDIMAENGEVTIPFFSAKNPWTDLEKAIKRQNQYYNQED